MLTQDELIEELRRRDVYVTPRGLTSWRAKGFLPRLEHSSSGRARGAVYGWNDLDLVERAILTRDLLAEGVRGEQVVLCLWFAGYSADLSIVRSAWFHRLGPTTRKRRDARPTDEMIEDIFGDRSSRIAKKMAKERGLDARPVAELFLELVRAFFFRRYEFNLDENAELVSMAENFLKGSALETSAEISLKPDEVKAFFDFVRNYISIEARKDLLSSTTDIDLQHARDRWKILIGWLRNMAEAHLPIADHTQLDEISRRLSVKLGPFILAALLWISKMGGEERISKMSKLLGCPENSGHPNKIFNSISEIWKDYPIFEALKA